MSSTRAVGPAMPALLTRTSTPPHRSTTSATQRSVSAASATSPTTACRSGSISGRRANGGLVAVADAHPGAVGPETFGDRGSDSGGAGAHEHAQRLVHGHSRNDGRARQLTGRRICLSAGDIHEDARDSHMEPTPGPVSGRRCRAALRASSLRRSLRSFRRGFAASERPHSTQKPRPPNQSPYWYPARPGRGTRGRNRRRPRRGRRAPGRPRGRRRAGPSSRRSGRARRRCRAGRTSSGRRADRSCRARGPSRRR